MAFIRKFWKKPSKQPEGPLPVNPHHERFALESLESTQKSSESGKSQDHHKSHATGQNRSIANPYDWPSRNQQRPVYQPPADLYSQRTDTKNVPTMTAPEARGHALFQAYADGITTAHDRVQFAANLRLLQEAEERRARTGVSGRDAYMMAGCRSPSCSYSPLPPPSAVVHHGGSPKLISWAPSGTPSSPMSVDLGEYRPKEQVNKVVVRRFMAHCDDDDDDDDDNNAACANEDGSNDGYFRRYHAAVSPVGRWIASLESPSPTSHTVTSAAGNWGVSSPSSSPQRPPRALLSQQRSNATVTLASASSTSTSSAATNNPPPRDLVGPRLEAWHCLTGAIPPSVTTKTQYQQQDTTSGGKSSQACSASGSYPSSGPASGNQGTDYPSKARKAGQPTRIEMPKMPSYRGVDICAADAPKRSETSTKTSVTPPSKRSDSPPTTTKRSSTPKRSEALARWDEAYPH